MLPGKTAIYVSAIEATCYLLESQKRYALSVDYKDNFLVDYATGFLPPVKSVICIFPSLSLCFLLLNNS